MNSVGSADPSELADKVGELVQLQRAKSNRKTTSEDKLFMAVGKGNLKKLKQLIGSRVNVNVQVRPALKMTPTLPPCIYSGICFPICILLASFSFSLSLTLAAVLPTRSITRIIGQRCTWRLSKGTPRCPEISPPLLPPCFLAPSLPLQPSPSFLAHCHACLVSYIVVSNLLLLQTRIPA
jgi:hypothetical protein